MVHYSYVCHSISHKYKLMREGIDSRLYKGMVHINKISY